MPRRLTRRFRALLAIVFLAAPLLFPPRAGAVINSFQAFPVFFSPNNDGVLDQVHFKWTLADSASDVKLTVLAPGDSVPARTIDLGARPAGADSTVWDGRNDAAVVLPDTSYTITLFETQAGGPTVNRMVGVVIDNTPPNLPVIDGALDTTVTAAQRTVTGSAPGADSVSVFDNGALFETVRTTPGNDGLIFEVPDIPLQPGANQFAARARDLAGNFSSLTTPVTIRYVNVPDLQFVRATAVAFSPNGDGVQDTVKVRVLVDAPAPRVRIDVRSGLIPSSSVPDSTKPVAHIYDGPAPADTLEFTWDVRDSVGHPMPDGPYIFRGVMALYDAQGDSLNVTQQTSQFFIDRVPPETPTPVPLPPATTFRNFVTVTGASAGAESIFVYHDGGLIGEGGGETYTFGVGLHLGPNTVAVQSRDLAGNRSAFAGPYTIDFETPVGFHANERFRAGDAFVFNLDKAANAVDVTLYNLRGQRVRTLTARQVQLHFDLPWDGKDERGDFAGDGPYVARATVTFVDGTRTEAKGAVVLVK